MDQFTVHREANVLFLRWAPGAHITYLVAVEAARALRHISDGETLPLVVSMAGIDGLALKARMGMNTYPGFSVVALIGDSPVDEVLSGFSHQSLTDTRYFISEEAALAWLQTRTETDTAPARRTGMAPTNENEESAA
ncbi:hypothetical protein [Arthrobacter sp. B1805]|uniref:DUF7793 family protein n=1 Tax=Arthrobacter sp. B1805 TaxID=2058892 RepID=UPI000CE4FEA7|nr:hypothetical protein [Arthrobacter sp. B1805]